MKRFLKISFVFLLLLGLTSCSPENEETVIPKKFGALRVSHTFLPKDYSQNSTLCNLEFTLPSYAKVNLDGTTDTTCFYTVEIPEHKASIHIVHLQINSEDDLRNSLNTTNRQIERHLQMADDVRDTLMLNQGKRTFARIQNLIGDVAEPMQFTITDSTDNFIFGRLIFEARPNYDSILPALNYVRADIYHMIESLKWSEQLESK